MSKNDENKTGENSLKQEAREIINPYGKKLPCCIKDLFTDEVICCPTPQILNDVVSVSVDCSDKKINCTKAGNIILKPSLSTTKCCPENKNNLRYDNCLNTNTLPEDSQHYFDSNFQAVDTLKDVPKNKSISNLSDEDMMAINDKLADNIDNNVSAKENYVFVIDEDKCPRSLCKPINGKCTIVC